MTNVVETPDFAGMDIGKLRQYASHLKVAIAKTATKEEIIEALERKLKGRIMPTLADDTQTLKPGYCRIIVNEDSAMGAENYPVYINANGYECTIPRGVEVIVPKRVVRTLLDAVAHRRRNGNSSPGHPVKDVIIPVLSYPFQLLEDNPGPEIVTKAEASKARMFGPRKRYSEMFGKWPTPRELTRAIEQGLISLKDDESLGQSEVALLNNKNSDDILE